MPIVDPTEHHHQILHGSTPFPSLSSVGVAANSPRAVPISKHTNEMMASAFAPPSPLLNCFLPPHSVSSPQTFKASLPSSYHAIFSLKYPPSKIVFYPYSAQKKISQKRTQSWRILAATGDVLPPNTPIEETQQIVPPDDSSGSTIISVLLLIAFVGLSILTVGVKMPYALHGFVASFFFFVSSLLKM